MNRAGSDARSLMSALSTELQLAPQQKRAMVRVLQRFVGCRIYIAHRDVGAPADVALALNLLAEGRPRAEIRGALMTRLGCRKTKAYKLITQAIELRARRER